MRNAEAMAIVRQDPDRRVQEQMRNAKAMVSSCSNDPDCWAWWELRWNDKARH